MALISSDGKTRAQRRAEAKALKAKAKLDAKLASKDRRKAAKAREKAERKLVRKDTKGEHKAAKRAAKTQIKVAKVQAKTAKSEAKAVAAKAKAAADAKRLSPASVRRYLTVAKLVSPIVVPIAYRAAVAGRGRFAELQASRAGVPAELLSKYAGYGAPLQARIATARTALEKVTTQDAGGDTKQFVSAMTKRLDNLSIAVDTAETMPPGQRRTAHRAIEDELAAIDADTLARPVS